MSSHVKPADLPDDAWQAWLTIYGERRLEAPYGAVYPRVSDPKQEEGWSLLSQLKAELGRAVEDGITILPEHIYWEVHTGEELWERPALTRMRAAFKAQLFQVVYFYAVDRFARRAFYCELVMDEAMRAGIDVRFILQSFDDTPEGHLMRSVAGYVAEKELYSIKERTNRGKRERLDSGKPYGAGKPPFGYLWAIAETDSRRDKNVAYAIDPATAPIVRRIFAQITQGRSMRAVCADLMRDGIPTPSGKPVWQTSTLSVILDNECYIGRSYANRWRVTKKAGKRKTTPRPRSEWVALNDGVYPALIDEAMWDAAQRVRGSNKELSVRNNRQPEDFLLRGGIVRCGECEGAMVTRRYTSGYRVYICHGGSEVHGKLLPVEMRRGVTRPSANSQALDVAVWDHVKRLLNEEGFLDAELRRLAESDRTTLDLISIDRRMGDIEAQLQNLVLSIASATNQAVIALITQQMNTLADQRSDLAVEREQIARRAAAAARARDHVEQIKLRLGPQLPKALDNMPYIERRRTLGALGIRVTVSQRLERGKWGLPPYRIDASLPIHVDSEQSHLWHRSQSTRIGLSWRFDGGRRIA